MKTIHFRVNGTQQAVLTDERRTLLEVLREDLALTGTKYGCGEGQCRACTVLIDGKARPSCRTVITSVEGRQIATIESLAEGEQLHPVQSAFLDADAMQCGYCVPGMILAAVALLRATSDPTEAQIADAMNGNICRCGGYENILKAVRQAGGKAKRGSGSEE